MNSLVIFTNDNDVPFNPVPSIVSPSDPTKKEFMKSYFQDVLMPLPKDITDICSCYAESNITKSAISNKTTFKPNVLQITKVINSYKNRQYSLF